MSEYKAEAVSSKMTDEEINDGTIEAVGFYFPFVLGTGNLCIKVINEPLLNTEEKAYERARSEFLQNGYQKHVVTFRTWRTDLTMNMLISVYGIKYKVVKTSIASDVKSTICTVTGVRYE